MVDSCPKTNSEDSAWPRKFLKGESFWKGVRVFVNFHCVQTFFWLVGGEITGQCFRNPVLSLKSPSSTWVGALVPAEELKIYAEEQRIHCYGYSLRRNQDPAPTLFLDCCSSVSAFPPFPDERLFESALWNSGMVKEAEWGPFPTNKKQGTRKGSIPERAPQGPAPFQKGWVLTDPIVGFPSFTSLSKLLISICFSNHISHSILKINSVF